MRTALDTIDSKSPPGNLRFDVMRNTIGIPSSDRLLVLPKFRVHRAPGVGGRDVDFPSPGVERESLVPGPGFPVALVLVVHDVELGEQLDGVAVRILVVGEQVVPRPVPAGPPDQPVTLLGQVVDHGDQVRGVAHLVGDVVHAVVLLAGHEVRRVVIGVAPQEYEEVADGVRPFEAEQLLVELLHGGQLRGERRHMAQLRGSQRGVAFDAARILRLVKVQRHTRDRLDQHERVRRTGADVATALHLVPRLAQPPLGVGQGAPDLVADRGPGPRIPLRNDHTVVVEPGGQKRPLGRRLDQLELQHLRVVVHQSLHVRGGELDVAQLRDTHRRLGANSWMRHDGFPWSRATTSLVIWPSVSIWTLTRSPGLRNSPRGLPTPAWVPVSARSPGSSVVIRLAAATSLSTPDTMAAVDESCLTSPLTVSRILSACGSPTSQAGTRPGPIGQNPSWLLCISQSQLNTGETASDREN